MSDLIDRQALLKQIDIDSDGEPGYYGDTWKFIDTIKNMPNVHDLPKDADTISRQAAIDALRAMQTYKLFAGDDMLLIDQAGAQTELMMLPHAQLGTNLAEVGTGCISREQAIEICNHAIDLLKGKFGAGALVAIKESIEELPPAQTKRIKGHWIKISPANIYECSECGKSVMTNDICAYDFCHGCGAKMEATE